MYAVAHGTWATRAKLIPTGRAEASGFGFSVGLSGDGATALVGAPGEWRGTGAAWVHTR